MGESSTAVTDIISSGKQPHALVFPYPTQGHITPTLNLAKALVAQGFVVTFVNLHINQHRILLSAPPSPPGHSNGRLRLEVVPDGLPPEFDRWANFVEFMDALRNTTGPAILELGRAQTDPPVTCVISGTFCPWLQDIADSLGVPRFLFWTQSASVFAIYSHLPTLLRHGFFPYNANNNEDLIGKPRSVIDYIPGLNPIPPSFLPTTIQVDSPSDIVCKLFVVDELDRAKEAKYILVNSFDELEPSVLDSMRSHVPPILPIGPIFLKPFLNQCNNGDNNVEFGLSLWKEDRDLLQWLDKQAELSVLYIAFGSIVSIPPEQVKELGDGLKASNQAFIWVLRPGHNLSLETKKLLELLPEGFVQETKGQGVCVEWAPQVHVLSHPSVGGFLTHCGWNSTLESISMGVPMLPWSVFSDQTTNGWLVVHQWKVGLEFHREKDGTVKKDELVRAITTLMQTEEGSALRRRVRELKESARRAVLVGGSSDKNLKMLSQACKEGQ